MRFCRAGVSLTSPHHTLAILLAQERTAPASFNPSHEIESARTPRSLLVSMIRCMNRTLRTDTSLELTGDNLTLADAARILHGQVEQLRLAPAARRRVEQARRCLHDLLTQGATLYGVNTGFGKLASQRIEPHEVLALQENLLRSHAVGMGPLLESGRQPSRAGPAHPGAGQGTFGSDYRAYRSTARDVQPRRRARHPGAGQRRRLRRPGSAGPSGPRGHGRGPRLRRPVLPPARMAASR